MYPSAPPVLLANPCPLRHSGRGPHGVGSRRRCRARRKLCSPSERAGAYRACDGPHSIRRLGSTPLAACTTRRLSTIPFLPTPKAGDSWEVYGDERKP